MELNGIGDVLKYVDENPVQSGTRFVAVNLDRIPLVERVRTMERKFAKLEIDVAENGTRVVANSGSISRHARDISANNRSK